MPDFVKLVNENDVPFDFHQNNAKRVINPGEDVIVPWPIAVTLFGHPNIPNIPPANERSKMYEKIRARHNYSEGLKEPGRDWDAVRPRVSVWDLETNEQVIMLIDDPSGEHAGAVAPQKPIGKEQDMEALQRQVAALTAQMERMAMKANAAPSSPGAGNAASPTAVEDGPGETARSNPAIDDAFQIPTADDNDIPTADDPQAVTVGEDAPPPDNSAKKAPVKKVAAKKVAASQ